MMKMSVGYAGYLHLPEFTGNDNLLTFISTLKVLSVMGSLNR